jgi:hypothetical protein
MKFNDASRPEGGAGVGSAYLKYIGPIGGALAVIADVWMCVSGGTRS